MSSTTHTLLDRLLENIKEELVTKKAEKMKEEILAEVDKKNNSMVQDLIVFWDQLNGFWTS